MTNAPPTSDVERATVLIEKRLHAGLSPDEQTELDQLVAAHPALAGELDAAMQENDAMYAVTTPTTPSPDDDLPPFDFDRARRVISDKLAGERRILLSLAAWTAVTPPMLIAISWPSPDWSLIAWCAALPATPIVLWSVYRWRESVAFRRALDANPDTNPDDVSPDLESAWARHIRRGRNEYVAMGACVALVVLALVVWLIELIDEAAWPLVPFALIGAAVMGYHGVRKLWTRRARERHERELAGLDRDDADRPAND
ncbi:MAG: hypothetical protein AAGI53_04910 [Planctomycetota bacterium]